MAPPNESRSPPSDEGSAALDTLAALARANVAVVQLTQAGEIAAANDAFAALTGYEPGELAGDAFTSYLRRAPPGIAAELESGPPDLSSTSRTLRLETATDDAVTCEARFEAVSDGPDAPAIVGVLHPDRSPSPPSEDPASPPADSAGGSDHPVAGMERSSEPADGTSAPDEQSPPPAEASDPADRTPAADDAPEPAADDAPEPAANAPPTTDSSPLSMDASTPPAAGAPPSAKSSLMSNSGRETETAPAKAFVALANALSDGIIVLDTASRIQYANPAVERILGYAPEELVGGSKLSIIPERLRETHLEALNRYLETGDRNIDWEYVELPGQHKDGREIPLGVSLNDFHFDGDRYFVGLFRDVSRRKAAERELRSRKRRLDRYKEYTDDVLDAMDDMFYVLDAEGSLQRWNRTLVEVTGYADDEIASKHALDFFDADDREAIASVIEEGFETGSVRVEAELVTSTGEAIPYEFAAAALEDPDGEPVLAGIGRDITERRAAQRRLEESNERLEQFAYAASHDLQEPLRMVTSYLQLIDRRYGDALDEDGEEFLAFAVDGAERMREMIDGLLQYSRVDTRGEPLEPVDLNDVLDDVQDDLQLKIEESEATIRVGNLPRVVGDAGQLRQLFQNLCSNAIEYAGDEPPTVEIAAERADGRWRLSVRDHGIGIDRDETDRIFEIFHRLHSHDEHGGTGIGLALCRRIVERHGGRIWVESESGEGSTFHVTLPAADGD